MNVRKQHWPVLVGLAVLSAVLIVNCSSNSNNPYYGSNNGMGSGGNNTGGGGTAREFASGNLVYGQSFTHVFTTAKSIPYYCRYHGGPGGQGMHGVITVTAGGTPTKQTYSISAIALPSPQLHVGDTFVWINNTMMTHTVESDN